ncbi:MAG: phosphopantothenoylcysteine decarboxylase [Phycisphaeraceae bacterium]
MHFLITAGPTREPIDAVRYIGNRSSGRMGFALARAAAEAGHAVTLLLGPVSAAEKLPGAVRVERFESTADLERLLAAHFPACDRLIMAAAVADYRPARVERGKLKRQESGGAGLTLHLEPTPDLVAGVARSKRTDQRVAAFALEQPDELEARAVAKLRRKGADAIVANPLVTMESGAVRGTWLTAAGERCSPGVMRKLDFARWLVERVAEM